MVSVRTVQACMLVYAKQKRVPACGIVRTMMRATFATLWLSQLLPSSPLPHRAEGQDDVGGDGTRRPFLAPLGPGPGSAAGAAGERGVEYPLYCDSNRERPRFAGGFGGVKGGVQWL